MPSSAASAAARAQVLAGPFLIAGLAPVPQRPAQLPRRPGRQRPRAHRLGHRQRLLQRRHRRRPLPQHRLQGALERGDRPLPDQTVHAPAEAAPPVGLQQRQQLRRPGPIAHARPRRPPATRWPGDRRPAGAGRRAAPPGSGGRRPDRPAGRTSRPGSAAPARRCIARRSAPAPGTSAPGGDRPPRAPAAPPPGGSAACPARWRRPSRRSAPPPRPPPASDCCQSPASSARIDRSSGARQRQRGWPSARPRRS